MSYNFGTGPPKTMTGFTLPTTAAPTSSAALGGGGDTSTQNKPATNLFGQSAPVSFNLAATSTPAPAGSFSFGGPATTVPAGFSLTTSTPKPAVTGFSLGGTATTTASSGFSLGTTASTVAPTGFSLGGTPVVTTSTTPGLTSSAPSSTVAASGSATTLQFTQIGSSAATTAASFTPILGGLGAPSIASTTAASTPLKLGSLGGTTITTAATTSTPVTSASATATTIPSTGTLTFGQLEDSINKWTVDLEEQGKFFINQAKELNAWDNLLISNSEKILQLNETIERVKEQQKQLDQELDFVLAQQNELDELSAPLEKQLVDIPIVDQGRYQMYQLSEVIDSQLKQMSEDLKEIVEHLNESNKTEDNSDPIIQISKILNAHMNSLQWIDRNTTQIGGHLEQISKLHELHKNNQMNI